jgi:ADP-ribose pyrophosphatase
LTRPNSRPDHERIFPGDAAAGELEIVRETEAAAGETARFYKDLVRSRSPKGELVESVQTRVRRAPDHDDGVVIAPIDEQGRVILIRQFRHAARMWLRELPRGSRERGESVEDAARREVKEEIGYKIVDLTPLGRVAADGALLETVPHLVAARVHRSGSPRREDTETIDRIIPYAFSDLVAACRRGDIIDGYTLAAVLRLQPLFSSDRIVADALRAAEHSSTR